MNYVNPSLTDKISSCETAIHVNLLWLTAVLHEFYVGGFLSPKSLSQLRVLTIDCFRPVYTSSYSSSTMMIRRVAV
jgi:hypothetical protein